MPENAHIDIETIERLLKGDLADGEAEAARRHLETCPLCGLELKRLKRFNAIDSDEDLARRAEWLYARTRIEKAFGERIAPFAMRSRSRASLSSRAVNAVRWLGAAAAAVAVVAVMVHFAMKEGPRERPQAPAPGRSIMRGAPPVEYGIALEEPAGPVEARPGIFKWKSNRDDDYFVLEIFTSSLDKICRATNVRESYWNIPDSLGIKLEPGVVYLWNVRGYKGLERAAASPNGWFKIERQSNP
ncbi:MAG: hypothetical protein PHD74_07765 [Candidatus Krumholzibacteria bacterium]|nr:hypothetical protein [Candidatus Krumholzibacteria bacterium]